MGLKGLKEILLNSIISLKASKYILLYIYIYIYYMEDKIKNKNSRIEAKKLSEIKKQNLEPLRLLLLNYVEDNENKIKTNVKVKLIKEITNSKTTATLQNLESKYITPLRFIKTNKPLPLTGVNRFNKSLNTASSKLQKLKRSHVGFELIQTDEKQSRAFNATVRVDKYQLSSLGSNVATDKGRILTTAYKKAVSELPIGQDFKLYSILNFEKKDGEATKEVSVNSGTFNNKEWGGWVNAFSGMIETTLQSAWGMGFQGASIQFGFIMTPAGGCYVEDEKLKLYN
jgi:hypothetical protein